MSDHDTLPPIADEEIVGMWRVAADDAASHRLPEGVGMDRTCDACRASTMTRYELRGMTLTMCGHHSRQHGAMLTGLGYVAREVTADEGRVLRECG